MYKNKFIDARRTQSLRIETLQDARRTQSLRIETLQDARRTQSLRIKGFIQENAREAQLDI